MATAARSVRLVDASNTILSDGSDSENETERRDQAPKQEDVEQIYAKEKKKRLKQPTLEAEQLIAALASIPHEFSSKLSGGVSEKSIKSAARYTNQLMQLYADFVAGLPPKTDLSKVQKVGSSRQVRDACKMQRLVVTRNPYLESVLGKEATMDLLLQLDEYEAEQRAEELDEINTAPADGEQAAETMQTKETQPQIEDEAQNAASCTIPVAPSTNAAPTAAAVDDDSEDEFQFDVAAPKLTILEDSEDEEDEGPSDSIRKRKRIVFDAPELAASSPSDEMEVDAPGSKVPDEDQVMDSIDQLHALATSGETAGRASIEAPEVQGDTPEAQLLEKVTVSDNDQNGSDIPSTEDADNSNELPATQIGFLGQPTQDYGASSDDEVATIVPSLTMPDSP